MLSCFAVETWESQYAFDFAEPLLDNEGEILDGGADITMASIASYYQDIIYVCSFVQILAILTDKAFWAFWLLPLVLALIVYNSLVKPLMQQYQTPKVFEPFSYSPFSPTS